MGRCLIGTIKYPTTHFEQATAANQPTHGLRTYNGLPVVDFDGTDNTATTDYMKSINTVSEPRGSHSSFWIVACVDTVTSAIRFNLFSSGLN